MAEVAKTLHNLLLFFILKVILTFCLPPFLYSQVSPSHLEVISWTSLQAILLSSAKGWSIKSRTAVSYLYLASFRKLTSICSMGVNFVHNINTVSDLGGRFYALDKLLPTDVT